MNTILKSKDDMETRKNNDITNPQTKMQKIKMEINDCLHGIDNESKTLVQSLTFGDQPIQKMQQKLTQKCSMIILNKMRNQSSRLQKRVNAWRNIL